MLTPKEIEFLQEELSTAKNPLFFYDGDGDGLCSFLILYRIHREGRGSMVKASPKLDASYLRKVEENNSDKIFILDIAVVLPEFVDLVKRPVFWIDHHTPQQLRNVHYYNPRIKNPDAYIPTSRMAYQISQNPDDLWLATVGCLYDWHLPDFIDQFIEKYPYLLPEKTDLTNAVYHHPIGTLVRVFAFMLKGKHSEVVKCIKILSRIKSPDEIMKQETAAGKFIYKRYEKINVQYQVLLQSAKKSAGRSKLILYEYTENNWSFTTDLANELMSLYPQKVIIIARKKSGEMKCSLRSQNPILPILEKALIGIQGTGGGHSNACGAVIKEEDWVRFLKNFKEGLKNV